MPMDAPRRIDRVVTDPDFAPVTLTLAAAVAAGTLLRLKADSAAMLAAMLVGEATSGGRPLSILHRYTREEMQADWNWYIATKSMAVLRVEEDLAAGATIEVRSASPARAPGEITGPLQAASRYSGIIWTLQLGAVPDERSRDFEPVAAPVEIRWVAGPCETI